MDWMEALQSKPRRQLLFSRDSPVLEPLARDLAEQDRRTVILWALELAGESAALLCQRYPEHPQPRDALTAAWAWASGGIKMPLARQRILQCHALARELSSREDIALCHAVAQACSTVHTPRHALGFPIYELTALVHRCGIEVCRDPVEARCAYYLRRLWYWHDALPQYPGPWAPFLIPGKRVEEPPQI